MLTAGIFDIPYLHPLGRFQEESARRAGVLPLFWAGSGLEVRFTGTELQFQLEADFEMAEPWIAVEVDGAPLIRMPLNRGLNEICVFRGASPARPRTVRLLKETQPVAEDARHRLLVRGLRWEDGEFLPVPAKKYRLEFVGDSLTSGEGVVGAQEEEAWIPAVFSASRTWAVQTADLLDASFRMISQSGWGVRSGWDNDPSHILPDIYEQVCRPASGETDLALGAAAHMDSWDPHAVLVNLGTNDAGAMQNPPGPGGFQQRDTPEGLLLFEDAALAFLHRLRRCHPNARLVWAYGMCGDKLRPQLERAVDRFCHETGSRTAYYLPLPAADAETIGSRQHPGPQCHRAAAEAAAALLRDILPKQ